MNEQLKKRLIGATVLVLLAVIFVPMLFNSGEQTEMPTFGSNVPPRPDTQFQTIEVPLQNQPPLVVDNQPVTTAKEAAAYEAQAANPPVPASVPATATPVPAPAVVVTTPAVAPAAQPAPKAAAPVASAPAKASATRPESGWAVQLGSFGSSANALGLRDKLRQKGFAAYVEHQKSSGYRVRVGPELKRENADALKARLEKAGFKGVVMPHP